MCRCHCRETESLREQVENTTMTVVNAQQGNDCNHCCCCCCRCCCNDCD